MNMYCTEKSRLFILLEKIQFLRNKGSEVADCSINCSYRPVVNPVTLNVCHKFAWSIALSKLTCSKSQI